MSAPQNAEGHDDTFAARVTREVVASFPHVSFTPHAIATLEAAAAKHGCRVLRDARLLADLHDHPTVTREDIRMARRMHSSVGERRSDTDTATV